MNGTSSAPTASASRRASSAAATDRLPRVSDHILIVGTGFAGLGMAIRLKQAGIHDFTVLEQGSEVGGTWRDNHYPGAACDVPSHLYSFSFEPNPTWTRSFANQKEILAYLIGCADKYGVRPHVRFDTAVTSAVYDDKTGMWTVETNRGETFRARVVVSGCGGLSRPGEPEIPGLEAFEGAKFHSARWDHSFDLTGKRVAVIGTGASAVQIVPAIAPKVGQLFVYQRTPPWIMPKPDDPIPEKTRDLFARTPFLQKLARVGQYWPREIFAYGFTRDPRLLKLGETISRRYLQRKVKDPALRAKLTPSYKLGCKRVLPTNDYYPALQRDNVELVTDGIAEVRPHGIVSKDGTERAVDVIVLATGFEAAEAVAPFDVRGREGRDLSATWKDGAEAYLGTSVAGFPNMFLIVGPNTGLGHTSMVFMIESQITYILDAIKTMRKRGLASVEVREDVQTRFNSDLHARFPRTVWASGCVSWYQTRSGKNTTLWPGFTVEYRLRTRRFDAGSYELVQR
jgi:cation diffusion facilitator CzcD-associated flavoprotein CzcO